MEVKVVLDHTGAMVLPVFAAWSTIPGDGSHMVGGSADLCSLLVLSLLPNGRFSEFPDCTAFIGSLKAQQSRN